MPDFDFDSFTGGSDASEFSLEAILAEFRSEKRSGFSIPESVSQPVILDESGDNIGAASIRSVDDLLGPEREPEPGEEPEPIEDDEEEPEAGSAADKPETEAGPAAAGDAEAYDVSGYEEDENGDLYAGAQLQEPEAEPAHPRGAPRRGGFVERLFTGFVALLALASMKRREIREEGPAPQEEQVPEMPAEKAMHFYAAQQKPLRLRFMASLIVSLILVYISFGYSAELPLAGAMGYVRVAALFCLVAELCVMMLGLDVLTHGLLALWKRIPSGESLVAVSCIAAVLDAVYTAIDGSASRGLPFCAVSALSMTFALWGGELGCRGFRASFKALALGKNPYAVTLVRGTEGKDSYLVKTQRDLTGFVRRSEETDPCEELMAVSAPFLLVAALVLSLLATVVRGRPGDFFHVLAVLTAVCAPFSMLFGYPLFFFMAARRLVQNGAAIAGWAGIRDIGRGRRLVVTDSDLFPPNTLSIGSIRVLEGIYTDKVISYTGSLIAASGSALAPLFAELMRRHGCSLQRVDDFTVGEGGIRAFIRGEEVAVGSSGFMHLCGVRLPQKLSAKNAVFTAIGGALVGVFSVSYSALPSVQDALVTLLHGRRSPLFAIRDFNVDPLLVRQKFKMATEGFEFPSFADRYRISAVAPDAESAVAAVLARDGLSPLVEIAERGLRVYRATRLCAVLTLVSACIGLLLLFLLCWKAAFESVTAGNVILYLSLWLVPVAVTVFGIRR
jgi:hypothetical protein